MLSGRKLFDADSSGQLMYQVLEYDVPPLASFSDVPEELSNAVQRAMDRDPSKRFATAKEFAHELEQTTELVSSRRVGEWVSSLCGEALSHRAEQMRAIEAASMSSSVVTRVGLGLTDNESDYRPAKQDALTEPGTPDTTIENLPVEASAPASTRRWPVLLAVLAAGAVLSLGSYLALRSSEVPAPSAQAPVPTAAPLAMTQTALPVIAPPEPTPAASAVAPAPPPKKTIRRAAPRSTVHAPAAAKKPEDLFSRQ
jgi:serine/threonine-protein kinase